MGIKIHYLLLLATLLTACAKKKEVSGWDLLWVGAEGKVTHVLELSDTLAGEGLYKTKADNLEFNVELEPHGESMMLSASARSVDDQDRFGYFSLRYPYTEDGIPYNFNGAVDSSEMYRQSPHDINAWIVNSIPMQAMPVVAFKTDSGFEAAFSDSPVHYNNYTSQEFNVEERVISLNSGDNGTSPGIQPDTSEKLDMDYNAEKTQIFMPGTVASYYHKVTREKPSSFNAVVLKSKAKDVNGLRKDIVKHAAARFSKDTINDFFGALAFTTAYFNLRANDSKKSDFWVVPAVEYSNTQYGRDAFWISSMLSPYYATECLKSELAQVNHFAEYPLFVIIWAYRSFTEGVIVDKKLLQDYMDAIEERAHDHIYYSYWEGDGRLDFQYWGDVMAFEKEDVISYNQGLFALALYMAQEMDLEIKSNPKEAAKEYAELFNEELGFMPISKKKMILGPDPLVPDLLAQVYTGRKLLSKEKVQAHYDRMVSYSKTPFGFKIVATPEGNYLPAEAYDIEGYQSQVNREKMPDGRYFRGGSYYLYDNLFLLDAYLHGIDGSFETLQWRVGLDFKIGSTTYETLNTLTGEPWKPNMGWNVAIYALWKRMMQQGKADARLLDHVDEIVGMGSNQVSEPLNH